MPAGSAARTSGAGRSYGQWSRPGPGERGRASPRPACGGRRQGRRGHGLPVVTRQRLRDQLGSLVGSRPGRRLTRLGQFRRTGGHAARSAGGSGGGRAPAPGVGGVLSSELRSWASALGGSWHETARFHHAARRRGGVAARGAGTVAGDAGDLISPSGFARSERKNVAGFHRQARSRRYRAVGEGGQILRCQARVVACLLSHGREASFDVKHARALGDRLRAGDNFSEDHITPSAPKGA
jgi:hypothetical protein